MPWASSLAARPGGIANVVAECSTIAGPAISCPASTSSSRTIEVSASPSRQRTVRVERDRRLARDLVELGQRRLLDLDRAVDDRLGDQVAELGRARRPGVDLRVGLLEGVDQRVDVLALLHLHVGRDDLDVVELAVVLHPHRVGEA